MSLPAEKLNDYFTYGQYLTWPDDEHWELIHGEAYDMSPVPSPVHQKVLGELFGELRRFLKESGSDCQIYVAPFDVRLPERDEADEEVDTIVQPDIVVICEPSKIDRRGCRGAPELVIEILSPATAGRDMKEKFALYEKHGVKEYWIVHPFEHFIEMFMLDEHNQYGKPLVYAGRDKLSTALFPELRLDLTVVFDIPPESPDPVNSPSRKKKQGLGKASE